VTRFGVMVAVAAVGLWLFRRELRRSGLPLEDANAGIGERHRWSPRSETALDRVASRSDCG
jgi:hypothetical protein